MGGAVIQRLLFLFGMRMIMRCSWFNVLTSTPPRQMAYSLPRQMAYLR